MEQKVIKIGNSTGIILPYKIREEMGIEVGDSIGIEYNTQGGFAVLGKVGKKKIAAKKVPELEDWLKKFNKKYNVALTKLAKK